MEQEINVQDIENQKPMELATGQGISRFQNVLRDDAVLANENLQKVVEKSQGVEGNIEQLLTDIAGEGAFRSSVEGMAGIPKSQQRLNELASLSSIETRQLQKDILGNELQAMGTMETRGFLDARDARANRESAIRSLTIASEAELLQGNLEQARALVDKAVSAKFEPMKQELEIRKFNLDRLDKTQLEPAQKAQAEATKRRLDNEMKQVETQEELLRTLTTNQAPADIRDKAMKAESLKELYAIPGIEKYFISPADKLDLQLKGLQIDKLSFENLKALNEKKEEIQKNMEKLPALNDKMTKIDNVLGNKLGLKTAVGVVKLGRGVSGIQAARGALADRQEFIAGVEQLTSTETLDTLINLKAQGGTLGALSEQELLMLKGAASKIGTWRQTDKDGNVTGYKASEDSFKNELQTLRTLTERAYMNAGGVLPGSTAEKEAANSLVDQAVGSGSIQDEILKESGY